MHIDGVEGDISELNDSESRFLRLESGQSDAADSAYTSGQVSRIRDFVVDDIYPGLNAATFPSTNTPLEDDIRNTVSTLDVLNNHHRQV